MTPKDFLGRRPKDFDIPENEEFDLAPGQDGCGDCFARVRLDSVADLQSLGLVPARLAADRIREAIESDDDEVFEMVKRTGDTSCGCGCEGGEATKASPLRTAYNRLRTRHNPALARVMSDHYGSRLRWDAPAAAVTRKWVEALTVQTSVVAALIGNITIGQNSRMYVSGITRTLLAHNIWIHRTGQMIHSGSYLKVWANSISRLSEYTIAADLEIARQTLPVWKSN